MSKKPNTNPIRYRPDTPDGADIARSLYTSLAAAGSFTSDDEFVKLAKFCFRAACLYERAYIDEIGSEQ